MSSTPLTIFCDFDGPIVDVSDRYYNTYQLGLIGVEAIYQAKGIRLPLKQLSKEMFWQMKQERTPDGEIAMRSGLQGRQIDLFLQRVNQIVNQPTLLDQDQLQQGVRWALSLLRAQGATLVLVTLRCQEQARQILRHYQLEHLFCQIWGSQDPNAAYGNHAQHKTELLFRAMEAIAPCYSPACYPIDSVGSTPLLSATRCSPSAFTWMIGDTEADILAGQALGIPTIALTCGIRSHSYLQRFCPTQIHQNLWSAVQAIAMPKQAV